MVTFCNHSMHRLFLTITVVSFIVASTDTTVSAQVPEIPVRGLRGIASVQIARNGQQTIRYNPRTCAELGPDLCAFFRSHEHGHVALNHLRNGTPTRQAEIEADRWAARNSSPAAVAAAIEYFNKGNGGSLRHGSPRARAQRVTSAVATRPPARTTVVRTPNGQKRVVQKRSYSAVGSQPFGSRQVARRKVVVPKPQPVTRKVIVRPSPTTRVVRTTAQGRRVIVVQ